MIVQSGVEDLLAEKGKQINYHKDLVDFLLRVLNEKVIKVEEISWKREAVYPTFTIKAGREKEDSTFVAIVGGPNEA